ncbi:MAG: hypothetical protein KF883_00710 [Thermomicrobiales bacterium]|nr:hypothetical protein [Thermomicrobiales bacterium]
MRNEQVCAGNVVCADQCCGGNGTAGSGACCGPDAYCVFRTSGSVCVAVQSCEAGSAGDQACVDAGFGSEARCVGGSCCPNPAVVGSGPSGPLYNCCPPQQQRSASGRCCGYPNYTSQCLDCTCSFARIRKL